MGGPVTYRRRPIRDRVTALLRDDSVRNFIWIFYIAFFVWGLWGSFWAYPIALVYEPMGRIVYDAWVWMPMLAVPVALGGLVLRHGGAPVDEIKAPLLRRDFLGLWMQIGGHLCQVVTLSVYVSSAIMGADKRQPIISVFVFTPYLVSVILLAAQCGYKVWLGRRSAWASIST